MNITEFLNFTIRVCPEAHVDLHEEVIVIDDVFFHEIFFDRQRWILKTSRNVLTLDRPTNFYSLNFINLLVAYFNTKPEGMLNLNDFKIAAFAVLPNYFTYFEEAPFPSGDEILPPEGYIRTPDPYNPNNPDIWLPPGWTIVSLDSLEPPEGYIPIPDPIDPDNNPLIWIPPNFMLVPKTEGRFNNEWVDRMTGNGTFETPYLIYTPKDFMQIGVIKEGLFKLMNNLDFSSLHGIGHIGYTVLEPRLNNPNAPLYRDGKGYKLFANGLLDTFNGTFDGDYHTIKGIVISESGITTEETVSLFNATVAGTIKNLNLTQCLFACIQARISNLNIDLASISSAKAGIILEDVVSDINLLRGGDTGDTYIHVGGLLSGAQGGTVATAGTVTLRRCAFKGNIIASLAHTGSLLHSSSSIASNTYIIENCYANALHTPLRSVGGNGNNYGKFFSKYQSTGITTFTNCYDISRFYNTESPTAWTIFNYIINSSVGVTTVNSFTDRTLYNPSTFGANFSMVTTGEIRELAEQLGNAYAPDLAENPLNQGFPILACEILFKENL